MSTATKPPHAPSATPAKSAPRHLGRYTDTDTLAVRELVAIAGDHGSTLVIDRLADTHSDSRLVAHLPSDEPRENASLVCSLYLADPAKGQCRRVSSDDLNHAPCSEPPNELCHDAVLTTADSACYRIREISVDGSFPQLRWTRSQQPSLEEPFVPIRLREVVAALEDYQPARITIAVIAGHVDSTVSVRCLRAELERLITSPIVLNRRLREVIERTVQQGELSMSEISLRCGRVKRDRRGNESGETSWLARRIGRLPEGGELTATPWIRSDTLALIARQGLGLAPRDVEL
jgi:hypothetical protein